MKLSRAWLVWSAGLFAYAIAVFHRTSMAVAGVEAAHRFGVGASLLAALSVAQLAMYALMQVPVGVLLDRFGSRRLLIIGASLMGAGQLAFAYATDIRLAIAARVLLGIGDAMTFASVLRVIALWFPARRNPLMLQLTAMLGQIGALASATPLLVLMHHSGWTATFLTAAGLGLASVGYLTVAMRDSPAGVTPVAPRAGSLSFSAVRRDLRASWAEPGTRLGLWTHFVTQFSGAAFGLMWGYPFLVAEGLAPTTAALMVSALTAAGIVCGPFVGHFCGRRPYHRSALVLSIVASTAAVWGAVLLWPGRAPVWLLAVLIGVLAVNGPGSMIGLDYARTFNPSARLGSATGIVNVGGFTASIILISLVGVVLDRLSPAGSTSYSLGAFRWAFLLQYLLWTVGATQVIRYRNTARRLLAERDPEAFALMRRHQPVLVGAD